MKKISWLAFAVLLAGCSGSSTTSTETTTTSGATTGTTGTTPTGTTEPAKTDTPASASRESIPSELKHEGYDYYGLGSDKKINMVSEQKGSPDLTGTTEFQFVELKDGKAKFKQVFGGDLTSQFPSSDLVVDKDGVYSVNLGQSELDKPQMELPAKVSAGKTWKLDKPIETGGTTITKFDSRIVGPESINVPLGTFDAMKVTADVEMKTGADKRTAKMTAWYAKGVGTVKLSMVFFDGKTTTERTLLATK